MRPLCIPSAGPKAEAAAPSAADTRGPIQAGSTRKNFLGHRTERPWSRLQDQLDPGFQIFSTGSHSVLLACTGWLPPPGLPFLVAKVAPGSRSLHPTISAALVPQESPDESYCQDRKDGEGGGGSCSPDLGPQGACSGLTRSIVGCFPETGLS